MSSKTDSPESRYESHTYARNIRFPLLTFQYLHPHVQNTGHVHVHTNLGNQNLFLLLQLIHDRYRYIERSSHNVGRSQSKPLGQANIGHVITFVEFNPDQLISFRCVLDVVSCREESASENKEMGKRRKGTAIIREYRRVTSCKIKGSGYRTTQEHGSLGVTFVEVEPFLGLLSEGISDVSYLPRMDGLG